jgi:hypothetical protein
VPALASQPLVKADQILREQFEIAAVAAAGFTRRVALVDDDDRGRNSNVLGY